MKEETITLTDTTQKKQKINYYVSWSDAEFAKLTKQPLPPTVETGWHKAIEAYLLDGKLRGLSDATQKSYKSHLDRNNVLYARINFKQKPKRN